MYRDINSSMMMMMTTRNSLLLVVMSVVIMMLGLLGGSSEGCWEEERNALLHLKPFFNTPPFYTLNSWVEDENKGWDCCRWKRVECNLTTRRVITLSLDSTRPYKEDDGWYLNASLFLPFKQLKSLDLSSNRIAGFLQNEGFALSNLESLDLSYNHLNDGNFLSSLNHLSSLKHLILSFNGFTESSHPNGFAKLSSALSNLESLNLAGNLLDDSIFSSLSNLSSLKHLVLQNNNLFTGSSHPNGFEWLSRLSNLETLDLSVNSLKNNILSHMGSLSLKTLSLSDNNLEGTLDMHELNNLTNLKNLDLSRNRIESLQPSNQGNVTQVLRLTNLEELRLGGNQLRNNTLTFPPGLSSLKSLYLFFNNLKGSIDVKGFNNLINLKKLDLSDNSIESLQSFQDNGRQLKVLINLEELDLSDNLLQGAIDMEEFHNLINLKKLDLGGNNIESLRCFQDDGRQLKTLTHLEELSLNSNKLRNDTFAFPPCFSSLKSLSLYNNELQGSIDIKGFNNLINLKRLDLDGNKIESLRSFQDSGRQPSVLTHLEELSLIENSFNNFSEFASLGYSWIPNLKSLVISDNMLKGSIDMKELSAFTNLEVFDMRQNKLNEFTCNEGWCDLKNLKVLGISWNTIQGILPSCLSNLTSLRLLDISYNQFTGNLDPLASLTSLRFLSLSANYLEVPMSFSFLANLTNLKVLLSYENELVMEPTFPAWAPKLQLNVFGLSNCIIHGDGQQLSLELPKFLYYQYDLRYVDLSYNNFSGTIPIWLLENNTKLETLFLMHNSFSGSLLGSDNNTKLEALSLSNMSTLDMSSNKIQGPIPTYICSTFSHLRSLFLSGNAFEGNILPCLGDMRDLSYLDLSDNQLSGGVPKELTMSSSSLLYLGLSNNNLGGKIHPTFFNSCTLKELYLDGNKFVGEIPDNIAFPTSLLDFDISNNCLFGKIPRWIWNMSQLLGLSLSNNHFEGYIPIELCNLYGLVYLDLAHNNLSGSIPSCFNPPNIKYVHLSENKLSGPMTHAFRNSSSLVTLDLKGNNLTGKIPDWIGTLSALSVLLLKANHFEGEIPLELCNLSSLNIVDLSHNMLSGPIPPCFGNLALLSKDDKYSAQFSISEYSYQEISKYVGFDWYFNEGGHEHGSYMKEQVEFTTKRGFLLYEGKVLSLMSGIDLSCNKLIGKIPLELGNLSKIHALNLSHNNLSGVIPSSISNLKQIESLDLSFNSLSGKIPAQLTELNALAAFSVAHNNLSGSIPEQKAQFGTFDESSYEGNAFLCGPLLHNSCCQINSPPLVSTSPDDEGDEGLVDMDAFYASFGVSCVVAFLTIVVVLYINPYWRRNGFGFIEDCITYLRFSRLGIFVCSYF